MADYAPRYLLHTAVGSVKSDASNNTASTNTNKTSSTSMSGAETQEMMRLMGKHMSKSMSSPETERLLQLMAKQISHGGKVGKARRKRFRLQIEDENVKTALREATKTYYRTMSVQAAQCADHETYINNKIEAEATLYKTKADTLSDYVSTKYGMEHVPRPKTADDNVKAWGIVHRMQKRANITAASVVQRYTDKHKFLDDASFATVVVILDQFYKDKKAALQELDAEKRKQALKAALTKKKAAMVEWRKTHGIAPRPRRPQQATHVAFHLGEDVMFTYDDIDDDYL
jgi:hypothetical protein